MATTDILSAPITIDCRATPLEELEQLEWLVTNKLGSYASATVVGANTRRYHGLLVAATLPPVGRQVVLSALAEQVIIGEKTYNLSTFQFPGAVSPNGHVHLVRFVNDVAPSWVYKIGDVVVTRQLTLAEGANTLAVRYKIESTEPVQMRIRPFVALRDYHALRQEKDPHRIVYSADNGGVRIEDRQWGAEPAWIGCDGEFVDMPQWWYRFQYAQDIRRGQDGLEDLYTPGYFELTATPGEWTEVFAACSRTTGFDFEATVAAKRERLSKLAKAVGPDADDATKRLAVAADAFCVNRQAPSGPSMTILAGYHWFADWGRDTFIALPGLALLTGQTDMARRILDTFAHAMDQGMIPNRFDDYGGKPHYNSIDASLWFIQAVDRYIRITGDQASWSGEFIGPVRSILQAYHDGTQFNIHADADGLLVGGSSNTQLTWMDVKFNDEAITPREGKAVEINALYLEGLHIMAERCAGVDAALADHYAGEAQRVAAAFAKAFWYAEGGYLYDCIAPDGPDTSLRPNQVIAVAQPHCPLTAAQQRSVVDVAIAHLLTPVGMRTLSPKDPRYRGQYGASWESRDRAYHQGTAWAWLMGPMVQAYLKVNDFSDAARKRAAGWLAPLDEQLRKAALGTVNEIFDGDAPHAPRGCVAQAWSVAELLRAKRMIAEGRIL